jgi:hypothetical protein
MIIRQGDVILRKVRPCKVTGAPTLLILAVGEESGHAHVLRAVEVKQGEQRFVVVPEAAPVHVTPDTMAWRHAPITVPPGTYEVVIEREYTPTVVRRVED